MSGAQVGAPRLPKAGAGSGHAIPALDVTLLPEGTPEPTPFDFIPRTPFPTWPAPFTYSPPTPAATSIPQPAIPILLPPDTVNILLVGSDRRVTSRSFRTDVLIILSIHPSSGGAVLISIPRDLYVYIPGFTMERINAAYIRGENANYPGGGPALLSHSILYNLGVQIHHVARVEMAGFEDLVDTLGGVDVRVACSYTDWRLKRPDLEPQEEDNWALYTVPAGIVHMDGDLALWYARSRKRSSDFDRSRRQQEVLRAAYRQFLRLDLIPRLPDLYDDLGGMVTTDLSLTDLIRLASIATRVDLPRVRSRFIGREAVTSWRTPSGGQVVVPKPDVIRALLEEAFDFGEPDPLLPPRLITVEVVNASSHSDWDRLAADRLEYAGFAPHISRRAEPGSTPTHLIDYGLAEESDLTSLQRAFNLPSSALVRQPDAPSPFPFRLVIGDDYRPCFDPTKN